MIKKRTIGTIIAIFSSLILTACSNPTFEPITIDGFTGTVVLGETIDQGEFYFTQEQLSRFLPDFNPNHPREQFTFNLRLAEYTLENQRISDPILPLTTPITTAVTGAGQFTFENLTFHHGGRYVFELWQEEIEEIGEETHQWQTDTRSSFFTVHITENRRERTLTAAVEEEFGSTFRNIITWHIEQELKAHQATVAAQMVSSHALLINLTTGETIFQHQSDDVVFPASVTKIMTVLLGIEESMLEETVTVSADFNQLFISQAMQSGFEYGEERAMSEILHAVMLSSGGEATEALANHVAGSYENFIQLMNERAQTLGLTQTHFVTATGLHDDAHVTTARDISILLTYALENPTFREIFTTPTYLLETPNALTDTLRSTLFHVAPTTTFNGGEIIGGRTGFTNEAGRCLASLATRGDEEFILITFGAHDTEDIQINHILDALMLYEYFLE